jgi:hypothetical protein
MKVRIESKNICIDVMSKMFPDHSWADAMRACNERREPKKLNACWEGISIRQWIVDKCSANRLIFETRTPIDRVHYELRRIVPNYVQKKQPIKITILRHADNLTIESTIADVHMNNMERMTELYHEAQDTHERYTLERHRLREVERELYHSTNSLRKRTEASTVLQTRLKSLEAHKQAVIDMYQNTMSDIEKELSTHSPEVVPGCFIPRSGDHELFWFLSPKENSNR